MKALTLQQPWAQLMAEGAKTIETRSWSTNYRGPLAIHAGKGLSMVGGARGLRECLLGDEEGIYEDDWPFHDSLRSYGGSLPLGAIVGTVELVACVDTDHAAFGPVDPRDHTRQFFHDGEAWTVPGFEEEFGGYGPGRFAWITTNAECFWPPIENIDGRQGLWDWVSPGRAMQRQMAAYANTTTRRRERG